MVAQLDLTPPVLTVLSPTAALVLENLKVKVSVFDQSGIDSSSIIAKLDNQLVDFTYSAGKIAIELTELAKGDHQVQLSVSDNFGNENELTFQFTVTSLVSQPPPTTTVLGGSMIAGQKVEIDLSALEMVVRKLEFFPATDAENAMVSIQTDGPVAENIPPPLGILYKYMELSAAPSPVENATVDFEVAKEWIDSENVDEYAVGLYRWVDENGEWEEQPTTRAGENPTHVFYSAASEGFSTLAITGFPLIPPTYALVLPAGVVTTDQMEVTLSVTNPTAGPLVKNAEPELRIGDFYAAPVTIRVEAGGTVEIPVVVDVGERTGTYDVVLFDVDEERVLASGSITIETSAAVPSPAPAPTLPILPIGAFIAAAAAITIGLLRTKGRLKLRAKLPKIKFRLPKLRMIMPGVRLPKISPPRPRLPKFHLPKIRLPKVSMPKVSLPRLRGPKRVTKVEEMVKLFKEAHPRCVRESPIVEAYMDILSPVAKTLLKEEGVTPEAGKVAPEKEKKAGKIRHAERAVKPFARRRRFWRRKRDHPHA